MDPKEQWLEHCRQNDGEHCDEGIEWAERELDRLRGEISLHQASACDLMGHRNNLGSALCSLMGVPFPPTADAVKEMRLGIAIMAGSAPCGDDVRNAIAALDALRVFLPNSVINSQAPNPEIDSQLPNTETDV